MLRSKSEFNFCSFRTIIKHSVSVDAFRLIAYAALSTSEQAAESVSSLIASRGIIYAYCLARSFT